MHSHEIITLPGWESQNTSSVFITPGQISSDQVGRSHERNIHHICICTDTHIQTSNKQALSAKVTKKEEKQRERVRDESERLVRRTRKVFPGRARDPGI
jgi:hypothetical protein